MEFYKTQTGTYMVLDTVNRFQCIFGKRDDGTFIFSQETIPAEMISQIEDIYQNANLTLVDWTNSKVNKQDIENILNQISQMGQLIDSQN